MHIITIIHSNHNYGWWSGSLEAELWTRPLQDVSGSSTRTGSDHRRQRWRFRPSPGDLLPTLAPEGQRHTRPRPQITGLVGWAETSVLFLRCPRNRNKFPSCTERNVERPGSPLPLSHPRRRAGCLEGGGGRGGAGWSGISPAGFLALQSTHGLDERLQLKAWTSCWAATGVKGQKKIQSFLPATAAAAPGQTWITFSLRRISCQGFLGVKLVSSHRNWQLAMKTTFKWQEPSVGWANQASAWRPGGASWDVAEPPAAQEESGQFCNPDCWWWFDDDGWVLLVTCYNNQDRLLGTKREPVLVPKRSRTGSI